MSDITVDCGQDITMKIAMQDIHDSLQAVVEGNPNLAQRKMRDFADCSDFLDDFAYDIVVHRLKPIVAELDNILRSDAGHGSR